MALPLKFSDDRRSITVDGMDIDPMTVRADSEVEAEAGNVAELKVGDFLGAVYESCSPNNGHPAYVILFGEREYRWAALIFDALGPNLIDLKVEVRCFHGEPSPVAVSMAKSIASRLCIGEASFTYSTSYSDGDFWVGRMRIVDAEFTFQDAFECFDGLARLADLEDPRRVIDLSTALRALKGAVPELLVGLYENQWLEVKSQPYDLNKHADRIELAKDVAQFANSPEGGLLVMGARTKDKGFGDRVERLTPLSVLPKIEERYRKAIDQRVFPPITGLDIVRVAMAKGEIIYVHVPPQAAAYRPFIVEGAVADGSAFENFFMIPQRRGSSVHAISGRSLHSLISGKLFLDIDNLPGE
ncbi:ATP-binding protein [Streptomyces sp. NPDC019396]|uniref:AlbA family DNA-binding domain-containing protein n=1 Tax=Streptomyces sp. NPDC019396 TaxID=3154687 RepID=UPI0033E03923